MSESEMVKLGQREHQWEDGRCIQCGVSLTLLPKTDSPCPFNIDREQLAMDLRACQSTLLTAVEHQQEIQQKIERLTARIRELRLKLQKIDDKHK